MSREYVDLSTVEGRESWAKACPRARFHDPGPPKRNYIDLDKQREEKAAAEELRNRFNNFKLDPDWWKAYV